MNSNSKTILLLEDDAPLNHAIVMKLEQKGCEVISTTRAEEALVILNTKHPHIDIVWLDLLMPGMNGIEFLAEVRKNPEYKDIKVVICSVSGRDESREVASELGVAGYLVKSDYDINSLTEKVMSYA